MNDRKHLGLLRFGLGALALLLPAAALAQTGAPALLPVQGILTDESGVRLTAPVNVTFSLYDVDAAGTAFHSETLAVTPDNGLFTVYLGTNQALDLMNFQMDTIYLGIEIASDGEMTPRFRLGTAAYAAFSQFCGDAATLEGSLATDFAAAAHTHGWADVQNVPGDIADGDDVLTQAVVEGYARGVCYDTAAELGAALPAWDRNAADDLTTMSTFGGDVTGTAASLQIAAGVVRSNELANGAVSTAKIAANAVTTAQIAANTINAGDIATNGVGAAEIAAAAVGASEIAANAVGASEIQNGSIGAVEIASEAMGMPQVSLPAGSMTAFRPSNPPLLVTPNFNYLFANGVSVTPTANGSCHVVASGGMQGIGAGVAGQFRVSVGRRVGAAGAPASVSSNSASISNVAPGVASATSSAIVPVTAGQAYYFGCAILITNSTAGPFPTYCTTTWMCT